MIASVRCQHLGNPFSERKACIPGPASIPPPAPPRAARSTTTWSLSCRAGSSAYTCLYVTMVSASIAMLASRYQTRRKMIASICMTMVSASISMFITRPASHRRRHRELLDLVQREADPREQGQHARLQECEEHRCHPDSVIMRWLRKAQQIIVNLCAHHPIWRTFYLVDLPRINQLTLWALIYYIKSTSNRVMSTTRFALHFLLTKVLLRDLYCMVVSFCEENKSCQFDLWPRIYSWAQSTSLLKDQLPRTGRASKYARS